MVGQKDKATSHFEKQIETLQEGLRSLARAPNLKELARLFTGVLEDHFQGAQVALFHHSGLGHTWQQLTGPALENSETTLGGHPTTVFVLRCLDRDQTQILITQRLTDSTNLGLLVIQTDQGSGFGEPDQIALQLSTQIFASAYQSLLHRKNEKELVFSLNHRVLQLNSLIETGIEVSKLKQEGSLAQLALERAASLTNASRGVCIVTSGGSPKEKYFFPEGEPPNEDREDQGGISAFFDFFNSSYTFRLYDKESRNGVVAFDETDQLLLDALARQVHASLENRYLLQQMLDKQKIEQDLAVAAAIQKRILPESLPLVSGYDIVGTNIPTKSVGGDYYDSIPLSDGRVALVVGDVAGKGIPAALLVSSFHAYLNAYLETNLSLVQLAQRLNTVICKASTDDKFITAFLALLDPVSGTMVSLNAGHNPVYLLKQNGTLLELANGGLAFGMFEMDFPFGTDEVIIGSGDRLLLYSDGLTEAMNLQGELYDNIRPIKQFILEHNKSTAKEFVDELIGDVRTFVGAAPQADDITILYVVRE